MSWHDIFQSFFGLPSGFNSPDLGAEGFDGGGEGLNDEASLYSRFHSSDEIDRMFRVFDNMFSNLRIDDSPLFHSLPNIASDDSMNSSPEDDRPNSKESLRDRMLKKPDSESRPFSNNSDIFTFDFTTPRWTGEYSNEKGDQDLDEKYLKEKDLSKLFKREGNREVVKRQPSDSNRRTNDDDNGFFSIHVRKSWSSSENDVTEEQETIRRGLFRRSEKIVTRRVGDRIHTVRTYTDKDGERKTEETFTNINPDEKSSFNNFFKKQEPFNNGDSMPRFGSRLLDWFFKDR